MPGVAVFDARDLEHGTQTSPDGRYAIIVASDCKELTFSCLGYKDVIVNIRDAALVKMEPDSQSLQEAVATGIYTRKAESFTGAVQTVTSEELKRVGNQNVFESLKNLDPSLMIFDNLEQGSNPNAMASMQLRGASSFGMETTSLKSNFINDPNMPLFILDGFETTVEKVQDMDMNRVESITILKDASAKAIYGAKAGNGVIVIETKSLRSGQTVVTYTGGVSFDMPDLTSYNLCNALEKLEVERREGYYTDVLPNHEGSEGLVESLNLYNSRLKKALEGESTYWLSKPLRLGISHKHSLAVELGEKDLKAFATVSYDDEQGTMIGSYRKTISGDVTISYRYRNWLFKNIMSISNMDSEDSPYGSFYEYTLPNPYDTPYDADGNLYKQFITTIGGDAQVKIDNPLYNATIGTKDYAGYLDFNDNVYVEYNPVEPLKIVGRFGVNLKKTNYEEFYPGDHTKYIDNSVSTILEKGEYTMTNGSYSYYSGDISAQFNKSFIGGHDLFATAQYSISETKYSEVSYTASGFPSNRMNSIIYARQYASGTTPVGDEGINRNLGILLTAGYSYMDRYMMDATVKTSASSVFGTDNKWGTFWSAGFAWNLHKEPFLSDVKWLQQLKVRGSLGSSGNQNYANTNSLPIYKYYNDAYYNGFTGATLANMENPFLGWEQKMDYNIGLDFRTRSLTAGLEVYLSDTENLVFSRSILPSTGFTSVSDNLGKVRNKGIEANLNYRVYQKGLSYVALFAKVAFNDNRVLEISDAIKEYNRQQQQNAVESGSTEPVVQYYDGVPLHSVWAVPSLGIDPVTGHEIFINKKGGMTKEWSASNLVNFGSSDPLYSGNFGVNGEIKGIGFSFVCTYYGGGYLYNSTVVGKVENTDIKTNVDRRIFSGRWYYAGQNAQYRDGYSSPTKATSRFVQRNDVLSLSSISLYYEFPQRLISRIKMDRLRLTLYANDLATFSSIERGTSFPYARTLSFSLTATF